MEAPLVSLCIYTYKQENFIKETLEAAVAQDYPNLEIIVSDDCSPDKTFDIIKEFSNQYKGPHKLIINRNEPNLGIGGNVMKLFSLSHGTYIVNNCGDDMSFPNRVSRSVEAIQKEQVDNMSFAMSPFGGKVAQVGFFTSDSDKIERYTIEDYIRGTFHSSGASRIMTRRIVDFFGPLNTDCPTEDSTFTFRSFLLGGVAYSYEHLVNYRIHGDNTSIGATYLKRINPKPIYNQYIADLNTAMKKGIVSDDLYKRLLYKFDLYLERETNLRLVYFSGGHIRRGLKLLSILMSRSIHVSTKKSLVRQYCSWIKNNL